MWSDKASAGSEDSFTENGRQRFQERHPDTLPFLLPPEAGGLHTHFPFLTALRKTQDDER